FDLVVVLAWFHREFHPAAAHEVVPPERLADGPDRLPFLVAEMDTARKGPAADIIDGELQAQRAPRLLNQGHGGDSQGQQDKARDIMLPDHAADSWQL